MRCSWTVPTTRRLCLLAAALLLVVHPSARAQTGACCINGTLTCVTFTEAECLSSNGSFVGVGTTCDPNPCLASGGACCAESGSCEVTLDPDCAGSRRFLGLGTTCEPDPCAALIGACCINGTLTCVTFVESACLSSNGTFLGTGTTCAPTNPCLASGGACCSESGSCQVTLDNDCDGFRRFLGLGTTCEPSPCVPQVGACCFNFTLTCAFLFESQCAPGTFQGVGTTCDPNPCLGAGGACCSESGSCEPTLPDRCIGSRRFLGIGTTCEPNPCIPQTGACCISFSLTCAFLFESQCPSTGASFLGVGTTCDPNPCLAFGVACCSPSGSCEVTSFERCAGSGRTPLGTNVCEPNLCPVACCNPATGECAVVAQSACTGTIVSDRTCQPNPCPPVALCRDATLDARTRCVSLAVSAADIDNGSHAAVPNCPVTLALSPPGPYPVGDTTVTLTVTDCNNRSSTCTAVVHVLGTDCNDDAVPDICQCLWDNAAPPPGASPINAQISHFGGAAGGGAAVADDFYLCPGHVHRVLTFSGWMLTNVAPELRKARLLLFEDCNGAPSGEPVLSIDTRAWTEAAGPDRDGYWLVKYDFDLCAVEGRGGLWLDGGKTYWWSLVGLGGCGGADLSAWVASRTPLNGSVPVKAEGESDDHCSPVALGPWEPTDACCIGCVNMAYQVFGVSCPLLWDQGRAIVGSGEGGVRSENLDATQRWRGADDFVAKPCDDARICLIDAWIWTSCDPVRGFIELYPNDCRVPGSPPIVLRDPTVLPTGQSIVIDGRERHGYILRFEPTDLTLPGGQNWWLSAGADRTGSLAARTYFAYGARCDAACTRHGSPSQAAVPPLPIHWNAAGPDLAFRIAVAPPPSDVTSAGETAEATAPCAADVNNSGTVTVEDVFEFLAAWFAGCP